MSVVTRDALVAFCDELLDARRGADYGPNGLQVEGRAEIRHVALAVSAHQALFERLRGESVDAIIAHHGILWGHQDPCIVGPHRRRVETILSEGWSLLAYHLPLDRHLEVGNAAALARELGLTVEGPFGDYKGLPCGVVAAAPDLDGPGLRARVHGCVGDPLTAYLGGPSTVRRVGIVTGGGQGYVHDAIAAGLDAFITGEVTEWTRATVDEAGIHYLAGGHYRTERFGVQALGAAIERRFGVRTTFFDMPNPA